MTQPRSTLISLEATPYYHCISRCVRRAWLCGQDALTGRSFDHRKLWLLERFRLLAEVFAIDIAAYAVMSNHYHLILHVDALRAACWTPEEVVSRWTRLYSGSALAQRFLQGEALAPDEQQQLEKLIALWRSRLFSISWFMARLNQTIAVQANREDGCTGRFWEGRFKSQALLDETALLSCMAYVDLNPVRAGLAEELEASDFTSIQQRIRQLGSQEGSSVTPPLMPFSDNIQSGATQLPGPMLSYTLRDYLELVDWTGRAIRPNKKGFITTVQPKLLNTLRLSASQWRMLALDIQKQSILILHGLNKLNAIEKRARKTLAA